MDKGLYKRLLLDHFKSPRNWRTLSSYDFLANKKNLSCGDDLSVWVKLEKDGSTVKTIGFQGNGCAISIASASILSEYVIGKSVEAIFAINNQEVLNLLGINESSGRVKCALLSIETLRLALAGSGKIL